jgi:hypothetical protein
VTVTAPDGRHAAEMRTFGDEQDAVVPVSQSCFHFETGSRGRWVPLRAGVRPATCRPLIETVHRTRHTAHRWSDEVESGAVGRMRL